MISERLNIYEYEEILLGQKLNFNCSFKGTSNENKEELGRIWRYAICELFNWDAQDAVKNMTTSLVTQFCLDKSLAAIGYDVKKNFIDSYKFVLQYAFPDEVKYNKYDETIEIYQKVAKLDGYKNDTDKLRIPKKFFTDDNGGERAEILLNYVVNTYMGDKTTKELYDFFSEKRVAAKWLRDKKLDLPLKFIYSDPLDYFHYSINMDRRDNFLYYNKRLISEYNEIKRNNRINTKVNTAE